MKEYQRLACDTISNGVHKPNRTGVDTISSFSQTYTIDLEEGFPLLTTKDLSGFRWNSLIHELLWYLSGEEHIQNLQEETKIWDAWADDKGRLDTAYGRFWRRYPVPSPDQSLEGESWVPDTGNNRWNDSDIDYTQWITEEPSRGDGDSTVHTFDQIQYALDMLQDNPHSRRIVINAWHPANATISTLPPCHFTWVLNVQGDNTLNLHLTQRSGDIALGIPFNIAAYSILATIIAQQTGFELGEFGHSIVDAHVYCGKGERGKWYSENLGELQTQLSKTTNYTDVKEWIESNAPEQEDVYDHVPGLLEQIDREPLSRPSLEVADKPLDELTYEDIKLQNYEAHDGIKFSVAE